MLVKIRDLWKAKRVIFVIATNYEERIDHAAKRKGRIDHSYLVLPQDKPSRLLILTRELFKNNEKIKKKYRDDPEEKNKFNTKIIRLISRSEIDEINAIFEQGLISSSIDDWVKKWKDFNKKIFGYASEDLKNLAVELLKRDEISEAIDKLLEIIVNLKILHDESVRKIKTNIGDSLIEVLPRVISNDFIKKLDRPQIRLESYLHRFKDKNPEKKNDKETIKTRQQPFDEVLGLIAMMIEDDLITKKDYFKSNRCQNKVEVEAIVRLIANSNGCEFSKNGKLCADKDDMKNWVKDNRILKKIYKSKSEDNFDILIENLSCFIEKDN
jgi:SpoVK/Ycf46/Vps4 family AAA+-type ATPase